MHYERLHRSLFLKVEINIFKSRSDQYFLKVEISNFKISRKNLNFRKLSNILLNNPWIKIEIMLDIRKYPELNDNENITHQNLQKVAETVIGEIYSFKCLYKKGE